MATTTESERSIELRLAKDPTTPKEKAIIDAVLADPEASHSQIADAVEDELGERPSGSWVSRVRSSYLVEADGDQYDTSKVDDIVARLDRVEDGLDDAARSEDVDRAIDAATSLAESVEVLIDEVRQLQATVELVEDMVARDISDEVVGYVLKRELDRVEDVDRVTADA